MVPKVRTVMLARFIVGTCIRVLAAWLMLWAVLSFASEVSNVVASAFGGMNYALSAMVQVFGKPIAMFAVGALLFALQSRITRLLVPLPDRRCPQCGYSLVAITIPQCPECGLALPSELIRPPQPTR